MTDTQTRRFCSLDDDLRERLRRAGIEQRDLLFRPDPEHDSRWLLSYVPPGHPPAEHAERGSGRA